MDPKNNSLGRRNESNDLKTQYFDPELRSCRELLEILGDESRYYESSRDRLKQDHLIGRDPQYRKRVLDVYNQDITKINDDIATIKRVRARIEGRASNFEDIQRQVINQEEIDFDRKLRSFSAESTIQVSTQPEQTQEHRVELKASPMSAVRDASVSTGWNTQSGSEQTLPQPSVQHAQFMPTQEHPQSLPHQATLTQSSLHSMSLRGHAQHGSSVPLQDPETQLSNVSAQRLSRNERSTQSQVEFIDWVAVWEELPKDVQDMTSVPFSEAFTSHSDTMLGNCSLLRNIPIHLTDHDNYEGCARFRAIRKELDQTSSDATTTDKKQRIASFKQEFSLQLILLIINMEKETGVETPKVFDKRTLQAIMRTTQAIQAAYDAGLIIMEPRFFLVWRLKGKYEHLKENPRAGGVDYTIAQLLHYFVWDKRKTYQDGLLRKLLITTESHLKQQQKSGARDYFMSGALNESSGAELPEQMDVDAPEDHNEDDDDLYDP